MNRVQVALWQLPSFTESRWQELLESLPQVKQSYAQRFSSVKRLRSFIAGHHLLHTLQRQFAVPDKAFRSTYGAEWEAEVDSSDGFLCGGISHSGNLVACVVSDGSNSGVDIEASAQRTRDYLSLVENYFSGSEKQAFARLPFHQQEAAFFTLWTLKESYLKSQGLGLSSRGLLTEFSSDRHPLDATVDGRWKSCSFLWREGWGAVTISATAPSELAFYEMGADGVNLVALSSPLVDDWYYPLVR